MNAKDITIPLTLIPTLQGRIERLSAKAKALGLELNAKAHVNAVRAVLIKTGDETQTHRVADVTVSYDRIRLGENIILGFAHKLSSDVDGRSVVRPIGGARIPEKFNTVAGECDHCGHAKAGKSARKFVYILELEDGQIIRVGSSCLKKVAPGADLGLIAELEALETWGERTARNAVKDLAKVSEPTFDIIDLVALDIVGYRANATRASRGSVVREACGRNDGSAEAFYPLARAVVSWATLQERQDVWSRNIRAVATERYLTKDKVAEALSFIISMAEGYDLDSRGELDAKLAARAKAEEDHARYYLGRKGERLKKVEFVFSERRSKTDYGWYTRTWGTVNGRKVLLSTGVDSEAGRVLLNALRTGKKSITLSFTVDAYKRTKQGKAYTFGKRVRVA